MRTIEIEEGGGALLYGTAGMRLHRGWQKLW